MTNGERYKEEIIDLLTYTNALGTSLIATYLQHTRPTQERDFRLDKDKAKIIKWLTSHLVEEEFRLTHTEKKWLSEEFSNKEVEYVVRTPINLFIIYKNTYDVHNLKKIGLKFCGLEINKAFTLEELGVLNYG